MILALFFHQVFAYGHDSMFGGLKSPEEQFLAQNLGYFQRISFKNSQKFIDCIEFK